MSSYFRSTLRQSRANFVDYIGDFHPAYLVPGYEKVSFFHKSRTCGGLKKTPSSAGAAPSVPECPSFIEVVVNMGLTWLYLNLFTFPISHK